MEVGGVRRAARPDRAVQARHLCRRRCRVRPPGEAVMKAKIPTKPPDDAKQKRKKAPVVMIHGAFAGPWSWDEFAAKFRDAGYKVHAPSLRHHDGEKPP